MFWRHRPIICSISRIQFNKQMLYISVGDVTDGGRNTVGVKKSGQSEVCLQHSLNA